MLHAFRCCNAFVFVQRFWCRRVDVFRFCSLPQNSGKIAANSSIEPQRHTQTHSNTVIHFPLWLQPYWQASTSSMATTTIMLNGIYSKATETRLFHIRSSRALISRTSIIICCTVLFIAIFQPRFHFILICSSSSTSSLESATLTQSHAETVRNHCQHSRVFVVSIVFYGSCFIMCMFVFHFYRVVLDSVAEERVEKM